MKAPGFSFPLMMPSQGGASGSFLPTGQPTPSSVSPMAGLPNSNPMAGSMPITTMGMQSPVGSDPMMDPGMMGGSGGAMPMDSLLSSVLNLVMMIMTMLMGLLSGGQDPSMGGMDPSMGGQDPSMGGMDPSMGGQDPSMGGMDPSMGGQDPSMGGMDPSMGGQDPSMGETPPSTGGCGSKKGKKNKGSHGSSGGQPPTMPDDTPVSAPAPTGAAGDGDQQAVLTEINNFRESNGLPPVTLNTKLNAAANNQSTYMAKTNNMTHTGAGGTSVGDRVEAAGYNWSNVTENVAYGYATPKAVVKAWIDSPGHRANLLNPKVKEIGVSLVRSSDGTPYWTQTGAR